MQCAARADMCVFGRSQSRVIARAYRVFERHIVDALLSTSGARYGARASLVLPTIPACATPGAHRWPRFAAIGPATNSPPVQC
jgi:hypothetical protein